MVATTPKSKKIIALKQHISYLCNMKLPMFEKDKANHVIYGVAIYALHSLVITPVFAAIAVFIFALGKEFYDKARTGRFSYGDIMATMLGAVIGFVISVIS